MKFFYDFLKNCFSIIPKIIYNIIFIFVSNKVIYNIIFDSLLILMKRPYNSLSPELVTYIEFLLKKTEGQDIWPDAIVASILIGIKILKLESKNFEINLIKSELLELIKIIDENIKLSEN